MPAERFTKKANSPKLRRMWSHVEDSELARGASKKTAIMAANGVIKKQRRLASK
jgi:hypothetical protein